jgi:phosphoribosylaminoimidazole-succinocarboxamide synthase
VTSVKEVRIESAATSAELGRGSFAFTDDYSVFDWGKMPDTIPGKGASLCSMGAFNFERLEANGVPTHYRGVVRNGEAVALAAVAEPPTEMAIDLTQVPGLPHDDGYDYDAFHAAGGDNYLVPLEIVFRNLVPVGSSLRKRSRPRDHGLAIDVWPDEPVALEEPIVEFSTKYEEQDRYLDRAEADRIAGKADLDELERIARRVNAVVTERAGSVGFDHQDGKIECLYIDGEIRVADVVGTFDENRFAYDGQQVSKEVIRQFYKRYDSDWVEAVAAAKAEATERGIADWRSLCSVTPKPLPGHVVEAASDLYTAGANAYLDRDLFDSPGIADAVDRVRTLE